MVLAITVLHDLTQIKYLYSEVRIAEVAELFEVIKAAAFLGSEMMLELLKMLVLLVVHPEKRCTTDCDSCTKTVPQPRKMGRNRGFFAPFCGTHVVHFSLSCTKVRHIISN